MTMSMIELMQKEKLGELWGKVMNVRHERLLTAYHLWYTHVAFCKTCTHEWEQLDPQASLQCEEGKRKWEFWRKAEEMRPKALILEVAK